MSKYIHYAAFVLMKKFNVDLATARKIKAGEVDPYNIKPEPKPKKTKPKDSEVDDAS